MNQDAAIDKLMTTALAARAHAYAPYSKFFVGAAVEGATGAIYGGCNVENASYGLAICAERAAIFQAIAAGETRLLRLLVVGEGEAPVAPCGACRQVMREFNLKEIFLCNMQGDIQRTSLTELLPQAFGPENLKGASSHG